jgi:hypothetical protein
MNRSGIGTVVAVGLAIGLAIIVVVSAVAFFPSPTPNPYGHPGITSELPVSGTIMIANSGGGSLNLTVYNAANNPVISITVLAISPSVAGIANDVPFTFKGAPLTSSNPEGIGGTVAIGTLDFESGGTLGTNYTLTVKATLSDGQVITEQTWIVAETQEFSGGMSLSAAATVTNQTVGSGTVSIVVFNMASNVFPSNSAESNAIVNLTMTRGPGFSGIDTKNVTFTYNGARVSTSNPLPIGATADTGPLEVTGGALVGESYQITVVATLASGDLLTATVGIVPQAG